MRLLSETTLPNAASYFSNQDAAGECTVIQMEEKE
jgi:hypothetical protein